MVMERLRAHGIEVNHDDQRASQLYKVFKAKAKQLPQITVKVYSSF